VGLRRAALFDGGDRKPHAGAQQADAFAALIRRGEAALSRVHGLPWWREWVLRRCVRRSGDATTFDSGLYALARADAIGLDDLDEIGAVVVAVADDAGLWLECERRGLLGASRFGDTAPAA
jgi:hypothetical protein